ncbi:MAG: aminopeptidase P family protein [Thaumarchaeota archaeon]|nr:aminopeptidase P family protein [Nitrososphaerota archaeon]
MVIRYNYPVDKQDFPYPRFSEAEYRDRYARIRNFMKDNGLDCLLVSGGDSAFQRCYSNFRWLTNTMGSHDYMVYCIFPADGEPTLAILLTSRDKIARSVLADIRFGNPVETVVERLKELHLEKSVIGIVEPDGQYSIPHNHMVKLRNEFSQATFKFVTNEFWKLRWVKSREELEVLQKVTELGDLAHEYMMTRVKLGMSEGHLFSAYAAAAFENGGEFGYCSLISQPMSKPQDASPRFRPLNRTLHQGDIVITEISPYYQGYEAQAQRTWTYGEPNNEYKEMYEVAEETWRRVEQVLRPGVHSSKIVEAFSYIQERGYIQRAGGLHWMHGVLPRDGPLPPSRAGVEYGAESFVLVENVCPTIEVMVTTEDWRRGVRIGDTFAITSNGAQPLHRYPSHHPGITVL